VLWAKDCADLEFDREAFSGRGDAFPVTTQALYLISGRPVAGQLPDLRSVIEGTDWGALEHAYGAAQDTPLRLLQLLDEDPGVQAGALGQLDISVLHQDSLCSATTPAALFVAAALNDPSTQAPRELLLGRPPSATARRLAGMAGPDHGRGSLQRDDRRGRRQRSGRH
jgi:hypothetical protein